MDLVDGDGTVLDAARDDVKFARCKIDVGFGAGGVAEIDAELAAEDVEEVVGVGVGVPDELALYLDDHDVVTVVGGDDLG